MSWKTFIPTCDQVHVNIGKVITCQGVLLGPIYMQNGFVYLDDDNHVHLFYSLRPKMRPFCRICSKIVLTVHLANGSDHLRVVITESTRPARVVEAPPEPITKETWPRWSPVLQFDDFQKYRARARKQHE